MKRLVVGVFVSSIGLFGVIPAATAATASDQGADKAKTVKAKTVKAKTVKAKNGKAKSVKVKTATGKVKTAKIIDWDAPAAVDGGFTTQRIDWD
jgi:2-keto-3-deoxy-6-phosphogluconate aldolase